MEGGVAGGWGWFLKGGRVGLEVGWQVLRGLMRRGGARPDPEAMGPGLTGGWEAGVGGWS